MDQGSQERSQQLRKVDLMEWLVPECIQGQSWTYEVAAYDVCEIPGLEQVAMNRLRMLKVSPA
jgi:hypothetical protein